MIKKSFEKIKKKLTRLQQLCNLKLIRTSDLFDQDWYLNHNPDVAQAGMDPAIHYLQFGSVEGRDPGPCFSTVWYLHVYQDVKSAGMNPLIHYLRYGKKEGRKNFETTAPQLNRANESALDLSFLSSYIAEIGFDIFNFYDDNYDHNRFGKQKETLRSSQEDVLDAGVLSRTLVNSVKIVDPFLSRFETLFNSLADNESRNMLVKLLAYRALGFEKVKLSLNTSDYWEGIKGIESLANFSNAITSSDNRWVLPLVNLHQKCIPITLYGVPFAIYTQFILEHYRCSSGQTNIEVEDGDFVIDTGACWGDTALYFANLVGPTGKVFSFEFVPGNLEIFLRNMDLNPHLKNRISIIKNAAWEHSNIEVSFSDTGPGTSVNTSSVNTSKVETLSIDDLVVFRNISHVDFIKMDIEGSELAALRGAIKTIKTYRPKLAISVYHKFLDFLEIPEFILSLDLGYRLYIRHFSIHAEETVLFAKVDDC